MYVLSIVAAIFLPVGFLNGLLGTYAGDIPGSEYKVAFHHLFHLAGGTGHGRTDFLYKE